MSSETWRYRVLRWTVPVDDEPHEIGGGKVLHTQSRETALVEVWTEELVCNQTGEPKAPKRTTQVFGTGHPLIAIREHIGSTLDGPFVWHVYEVES